MQARMQGQPLPNLILPADEYQLAIVFRLRDEYSSKVLGLLFDRHDARFVFLHIPRYFHILDQGIGDEFDFARVVENTKLDLLFLSVRQIDTPAAAAYFLEHSQRKFSPCAGRR
jgi:hypothetical protein